MPPSSLRARSLGLVLRSKTRSGGSVASSGAAHGDEIDVFVKDLTTGTLELMSRNVAGEQGAHDATNPGLSGNGRWLVFGGYSANHVPAGRDSCSGRSGCGSDDTTGYSFVVDRDTGWVAILTVAADGTAPDDWDQTAPVISGDGRYVIFRSRSENMVVGASNTTWQLYWVENPLWAP
jgi:Tol biopolymer transport system component